MKIINVWSRVLIMALLSLATLPLNGQNGFDLNVTPTQRQLNVLSVDPAALIYFDDAYYTVGQRAGDSIALNLALQLSDHPDFADMPADQPVVYLEYFALADTARFYELYAQRQYIFHAYADFEVDFTRIALLTHAERVIITQSYVRRLADTGNRLSHEAALDFSSKLDISNCHIDTVFWNNIVFHDSVQLQYFVARHCYISGCRFLRNLHVEDVNTAHMSMPIAFSYELFECSFYNLTLSRSSRFATMSCAKSSVQESLTVVNWAYDFDVKAPDTTARLVLDNTTVGWLDIRDHFRGISIYNVRVEHVLHLDDMEWDAPRFGMHDGIGQIYMAEGSYISLTPHQNLGEVGMGLDALQNVRLEYVWKSYAFYDQSSYYAAIEQNVDRLKQYVNEFKTADKIQKDDVLSWLEYQAEYYRRDFYRATIDDEGHRWKLFVSNSLEFLVRNGHHGEWVFLFRALFLIAFFMLIYVILYRRTIDAYVTKDVFLNPDDAPSPRLKKSAIPPLPPTTFGDFVLSLTKSAWFSFVVFVNPRFPSKYFKFHRPLVYFVIVEWSIGLFMLCIFAYFIASKFPFIKALFGV